jgi:hypothetical protein
LAVATTILLCACRPNGVFDAGPAAGTQAQTPPVAFPLRVEAGKRYLVDAAGEPFQIRGDSAWGLLTKLTREEVTQYLQDRRAKGFNAVMVMLVSRHVLIGPSRNVYGEEPFAEAGDFGTPNERYFAHVDWVLNKALEMGILVLLAPAYTGYQGTGEEGWYPTMKASGVARLRAYGRYVGARYRGFGNIIWVNGGDFSPPDDGKDLIRAVAEGIRDVLPRSLHTFHGGRGTAALQYWGSGEPWLNVNNIYTHENTVVSAAFGEFERSSMPFFLIEARYENEGAGTPAVVRTQAYQAVLSGAAGQIMGNRPMWGFMSGWRKALNSASARSMGHLRNLFEARSWWLLQPDADGSLLSAGIGDGVERAAAARAVDGSFAIAYLPTARTVTIELRQLAGPKISARWCDPTSGACSVVYGSPFRAAGARKFRPAARNGAGFGDWTLVLESVT